MIYQLTRIALSALALAGLAGSAQAALIAETYGACEPTDGCEGSTLFLSVDDNDGSGGWLVTYTINTENYTGDLAGFSQIGFKAIDGWTTGTVLSSPDGSISDWNPLYESTIASNSLCGKLNGDPDKVCVFGFVDIRAPQPDGTYNYTWVFQIDDGTLIADTSEWHLGAQYADGLYRDGSRVGSAGHIISTNGGAAPVPEPTAAVLFGLGAILVTRSVRRR